LSLLLIPPSGSMRFMLPLPGFPTRRLFLLSPQAQFLPERLATFLLFDPPPFFLGIENLLPSRVPLERCLFGLPLRFNLLSGVFFFKEGPPLSFPVGRDQRFRPPPPPPDLTTVLSLAVFPSPLHFAPAFSPRTTPHSQVSFSLFLKILAALPFQLSPLRRRTRLFPPVKVIALNLA